MAYVFVDLPQLATIALGAADEMGSRQYNKEL